MFSEIDSVPEEEAYQIIGRYVTGEIELVEAAIELSISTETLRELLQDADIAICEPSRDEIVQRAADCFEEDEEFEGGYSFSYSDQLKVDDAISSIIERTGIKPSNFHISETTLKWQIREWIWEAKQDADETTDVFWSKMDNVRPHLGIQDRTKYTIVFPLNVVFADVPRPEEYQVLNQTIEAISDEEWETCYQWALDREEERAEESPAINAWNKLERHFETSPNSLDRGGQTYWMFECDALDRNYALNTCENTLRFLLGRINFAVTRNRLEGGQTNSSVWNTRWMDLRLPFVYLIFEDNEYADFSSSNDPTPRKPIKLSAHKADQYKTHLKDIPTLNRELGSMEARLVKAVRSFNEAVTSPLREDVFLNHWRSAERLTLTTEDDSMADVVNRARTVMGPSPLVSLSEIRQKRNKLVHEGDSVEFTTEDTNTMKHMLEELIMHYANHVPEWGHDEFLFYFRHGDKSDAALDDQQQEREKEIELLKLIRQRS